MAVKERILVIEDEVSIREEIVDWLIFEGYDVFQARNGREGLAVAKQERPDLILCDVVMPEMDGHEVLLEVRSTPELVDTLFIFVTAMVEKTNVRQGMNLGADDYIMKPFTAKDVLDAVRSRLAHKATRQQELQIQIGSMEDALQDERRQAMLRSQLVGMFSHDFRTPLAVITMSASLLRNYEDRLTPDRKKEKFDQMISSTKQLTQMLDDVLFVVEMGNIDFNYRPVWLNLSEFIRKIVVDYQDLFSETHQIHFVSRLDKDVAVDPKVMRQIASNLISNGIKYSPRRGEVWVSLDRVDDMLVFEVRDNGLGIPEESIDTLFEPFQRAENTRLIRGTGLGLAIVKQALDLCGGRIEVSSQEDVGSEFTIYLPLQTAPSY